MTMTFESFGLRPELLQAVNELGYEEPTAIQCGAVPLLLEGHDLLGQAQTGTGKTAAFALPMLQGLVPEGEKVQALVVAPTRELASQVASAIHGYGQFCGVRVLPIYGGQAYSRQINRLRRGVDVVVGTPGRLLDLLKRKELDLSSVRFLVLDEADEMLSMGFIEDIEAILSATPADRQTALFSATLPDEVRRIADQYMHSPESITVDAEQLTVANTEQRGYIVHQDDKLAALAQLLEVEEVESALIFARTRVGTAELAEALFNLGFQAEALHGDLPQASRETILNRFRRGAVKMLVATDVAARGLDIDGISHVFNYDVPLTPDQYVHRIGRTGRAGREGIAITLVTPRDGRHMAKIEQYTGQLITKAHLPKPAAVQALRDQRFLAQLQAQFEQVGDQAEPGLTQERALVDQLIAAGCDPLDIAASAIRMARAQEQQRPIEKIRDPRKKGKNKGRANSSRFDMQEPDFQDMPRRGQRRAPRVAEADMVRLYMDMGRAQQVRPSEIVGAIAGTTHIPGEAIGAIKIQQDGAFVDVREQHVGHVLNAMKGWTLRGQMINLERAR